MTIKYKLKRVNRWAPHVGWWEAIKFELVLATKPRRVRIRVNELCRCVQIRPRTSDVPVFETVFIAREFADCLPRKPKLIIDGGANVGYSTAFYAKRFPDAIIAAVEPSSSNLEMLKINTQGFHNIKVFEGGLWSHSGCLRIANPGDQPWCFYLEPARFDDPNAFPAFTINDVINACGVDHCDLLKLDIEGGEAELFQKSTDWLGNVNEILVEVHGKMALQTIHNSCPKPIWVHEMVGEKLFLKRNEI